MILDLRAKQPNKREHKCYFCTNTQWSCNQPPLLLTDTGGYYMFGRDEEDDEWKIRSAARAWEKLEDQRSSDRGDSECTIM